MVEATGAELPFKQDKEFSARLEVIIDSLGSLGKAGRAAGTTPQQVARWRDLTATPNFFGLANLCLAAGFSTDWLLTGTGRSGRHEKAKPDQSGQFVYVPRLDVRPSAGHGSAVDDEDAIGVVAFRTDWLHRRGIHTNAAHVLTARGDSMEPTIRDGDILLVDSSIDRVLDNAIYVVVYAGRTLVKRVQLRLDGSVVLKSDNREIFDDEAVAAADVPALNIAGRVMWFGRSI